MKKKHFKLCLKALSLLENEENGVYAAPFQEPVNIPGYKDIIKHPMDLSKIRKRLGTKQDKCKYDSPQDFSADVRLMLRNALVYNKEQKDITDENTVYHCAQVLQAVFKLFWKEHFDSKKRKRKEEADGDSTEPPQKLKKVKLKVPTKDVPPPPPPPPPASAASASTGVASAGFPHKSKCKKALEQLMAVREAKMFLQPDKTAWESEEYKQLVPDPVALSTVHSRLEEGKIETLLEFYLLTRRVFVDYLRCFAVVQISKTFKQRPKAYRCLDAFDTALAECAPKAFDMIKSELPQMGPKDTERCGQVIENMLSSQQAYFFVKPVACFGTFYRYDELVKNPMDFSEVQRKLHEKKYESKKAFGADLLSVFDNAIHYYENEPTADVSVYEVAKLLKKKVPSDVKPAKVKLVSSSDPSKAKSLGNKKSSTANHVVLSPELQRCRKILDKLLAVDYSVHFSAPVDTRVPGLEVYTDVIKEPMDLGTIQEKLLTGKYKSRKGFVRDVRLVFSNCLTFNKDQVPSFPIRTYAEKLSGMFESQVVQVFKDHAKDTNKVADELPPPPPPPQAVKSKAVRTVSPTSPVSSLPASSPTNEAERKPGSTKKAIMRYCMQLLKKLIKQDKKAMFLQPVDWQGQNLLDYPMIVKQPMDFSTIKRKITSGAYAGHEDFAADVRLVFSNCLLYNKAEVPTYPVITVSRKLREVFEEGYEKIVQQIQGNTSSASVEIPQSLSSFKSPPEKRECEQILSEIKKLPASQPFRVPFDWKQTGDESYPQIVKNPMDLRTIGRNLKKGLYENANAFRHDVQQVFKNCIEYRDWLVQNGRMELKTPAGQSICSWASELLTTFDTEFEKRVKDPKASWQQQATPVHQGAPKISSPSHSMIPPPPPPSEPDVHLESQTKQSPSAETVTKNRVDPAKNEQDSDQLENVPKLKLKLKSNPPSASASSPPSISTSTSSKKSGKKANSGKAPRHQASSGKAPRQQTNSGKAPRQQVEQTLVPLPVQFAAPPLPEHVEYDAFEIACDETLRKVVKFPWVAQFLGAPVLEMYTSPVFQEHYKRKIAKPMDFQTVFQKLHSKQYKSASEIASDVHLLFDNAVQFNDKPDDAEDVSIRSSAELYREIFEDYFAERQGGDPAEKHSRRRQRDSFVKDIEFEQGKSKALRLVNKLMANNRRKINEFFVQPLLWDTIPGYLKVISKPMDLGTVKSFATNKVYMTLGEFASDIRLVFSNCLLFNQDIPQNKVIREAAVAMQELFEDLWVEFTIQMKEAVRQKEIQSLLAKAKSASSIDVEKANEEKRKRLQRLKEEQNEYYMNRAKQQHRKQFGMMDDERNQETAEVRAERRARERLERQERLREEARLQLVRQKKYMAMVQRATKFAMERSLQFEKEQKLERLQAQRRYERELQHRSLMESSNVQGTPAMSQNLNRSGDSSSSSIVVVMNKQQLRKRKRKITVVPTQQTPERDATPPGNPKMHLAVETKIIKQHTIPTDTEQKPMKHESKRLSIIADSSVLIPPTVSEVATGQKLEFLVLGTCEKLSVGKENLFLTTFAIQYSSLCHDTSNTTGDTPTWKADDRHTVGTQHPGRLLVASVADSRSLGLFLHINTKKVSITDSAQRSRRLTKIFNKLENGTVTLGGELQDDSWLFGVQADPLGVVQFTHVKERLGQVSGLNDRPWKWDAASGSYYTEWKKDELSSKPVLTMSILNLSMPVNASMSKGSEELHILDSETVLAEFKSTLGIRKL